VSQGIAPALATDWLAAPALLAQGQFPERAADTQGAPDRWLQACWLRRPVFRRAAACFLADVAAQCALWQARSDTDLRAALGVVAAPAFASGRPAELAQAVAMACIAARRSLGWSPHPPQQLAAARLLGGHLVELDTGEGKTLAAALAACVAGCAGVATHVVTVNDYLAERDAATMAPLFAHVGLDLGVVHGGVPAQARAAAYARPVTYCTNKELVFDYLRDSLDLGGARGAARQAVGRLLAPRRGGVGQRLRGLHFAIVDEADSVLVDEARTPMVLAGERGEGSPDTAYRELLEVASGLVAEQDFRCVDSRHRIELTERGRARLEVPSGENGISQRPLHWAGEHFIQQALRALHLVQRDRDYVVRDNEVVIVDASTGRLLPDRHWEQGLHQLIEAKEGLAPSGQGDTLARMTSQDFFSRYLRLAGTSGTVREIAQEIAFVHGLRTERVERNLPCRREQRPALLLREAASKRAAVVAEVHQLLAAGRAVLVGTASVRASRALGAALQDAGIEHQILDALQDEREADLVARAGRTGAVTVATDMAGRGTDIVLDEAVRAAGGLHVVLTEWHESARVDRQLFGRCARQGDPGSCRAIVALDDELIAVHARREAAWIGRTWRNGMPPRAVIDGLRRLVQSRAGRHAARQRRATMEMERQLRRQLAFSGSGP
jgi:preprotein translocase subunit SecA